MFNDDSLYAGRYLGGSPLRGVDRVEYLVYGVELGRELLDVAEWKPVKSRGSDSWRTLDGVTSANWMLEAAGTDRWAAIVHLSVATGPVRYPSIGGCQGFYSAVVLDLWTVPWLNPAGTFPTFPGGNNLAAELACIYQPSDATPRETSRGE